MYEKQSVISFIWLTSRLVLLCFFLSACSYEVLHFPDKAARTYGGNNASVSSIPSSGTHRVQSGETLFSIAFRYGLDYRELAKFNRIDPPYTIYPKQKIRLINGEKATVVVQDKSASSTPLIVSQPTKAALKTVPTPSVKVPKPLPKNDASDDKISSGWAWPVDGAVTRGFSNAGVSSKGIDIKAEQGALVKAAADGTVVYAGSGLIGYGNLVIIKHNDVYLSAYAYNERILVKEKQNVRLGDSLAVIGGKGNDRPLLHFEVRRDGQPIDPLDVLPKN